MNYWQTVEKMWGKTAAEALHWIVFAITWAAILIGIILVMVHIISVTLSQMKEHDKTFGEALKISMHGMVKYIIGIIIAIIIIPVLWEVLVPFLISQGYDPSADPVKSAFNIMFLTK